MELNDLGADARKMAQECLGYLNFSSGAPDSGFLKNLNALFGLVDARPDAAEPTLAALAEVLRRALEQLHDDSDAFRRTDQAEAVLRLVFEEVLPAYRRHHRDLLFHQTEQQLFRPFFLGRVCEAVLQQGGPWNEQERIVRGALGQLNDFLGYRPVAVLETEQKIQPYAHEYVRPIPLWIRGAGAAAGPYRELIERALMILETTDSTLLFQAWFEPEMLDELALDPRAYDFDHPVNKRPNYLFGQWDMDCLDNSGRCRRFVLQGVSLDAMVQRIDDRGELPRDEILFEAAAVLAGTMLMGSGVSGNRPDAHSSDTTLATLVQHIAVYRDEFYERLLAKMSGPHLERLRREAAALQQPFGGARQHFNQRLARRRSEQLQHVHLAQLFARMGSTEAATRQVRVVEVTSARMQCDIHCRISTAHSRIDLGRLDEAAAMLPEVEDLLHRAIECGAMVDPWNMLGFGAQYSLFPAVENSIPDHRVEELIELVGEIFDLYVRAEKEAAAIGNNPLRKSLSEGLDKLGQWWDRFASLEVDAIEGISGSETRASAEHVSDALQAWHEAGTAAGDIAFWRGEVERFRSPKAYALVVEALLEQRDAVAAMALLVQWLSQAEQIPLVEESYAFHDLAMQWMEDLWQSGKPEAEGQAEKTAGGFPLPAPEDRWSLSRRFLDHVEANADEYWEVPQFELAQETPEDETQETTPEEADHDDLFSAAYENVTYRDTTDDGFEGEMLEGASAATDFELVHEADRIIMRLTFLSTLARLWKLAALASASGNEGTRRSEVLTGWLDQATANRRGLLELLAAVDRYRIVPPRGTHEALVEYDRQRGVKEMLLEQIIGTCVDTADAGRMICAAVKRRRPPSDSDPWEAPAVRVLRTVLRGDIAAVRRNWRALIDAVRQQPLLYVALVRGGNPAQVVASRSIQCVLRRLLAYLPRLGLLKETSQLIETIQEMELDHPVGPGAITEFDQMFHVGCRAIVRCLVVSSSAWYPAGSSPAAAASDQDLIDLLEKTTETLLRCWLAHSRGVRLSVLEAVHDESHWHDMRKFIDRYGADLFTQHFMNMGNLRAILHQGVDAWLQSLEEVPGAEDELRLLQELDGPLPRQEAINYLEIILEAVVENYPEYIDYNSTTTQSDRGEMLYTLLDFLRLRVSYDRVAWNLQPVVLAHDVLVRCGRDEAAAVWRKAVARRTKEIADDHLERLAELVRKYGMQLPSIAERLGERFVRPLEVDRLRALVRPAIDELREGRQGATFARLEEGIADFTANLTGAGFEVPAWLDALEQEADQPQSPGEEDEFSLDPHLDIPQVCLSPEEAQRQVDAM